MVMPVIEGIKPVPGPGNWIACSAAPTSAISSAVCRPRSQYMPRTKLRPAPQRSVSFAGVV